MATLGKEYKDGEVIVREGEAGNCMFVVQEGEVEAVTESDGRELRLRTMGADEIFGEMALFERKERSAKAVAIDDCILLALDEEKIQKLLTKAVAIKLLFNLAKMLSRRLRETNLLLARAKKS